MNEYPDSASGEQLQRLDETYNSLRDAVESGEPDDKITHLCMRLLRIALDPQYRA